MKKMKNLLQLSLMAVLVTFTGCDLLDDKTAELVAPSARFTFVADETNYLSITFTDASLNAESYSWTFGDGGTSTEANPIHIFEAAGDYDVTLTVTNGTETDSRMETLSLVDPLAAQRALIGDNGKSWKLLRDVSTGNYPFEVGPSNRSEVWFGLGLQQPICERSCVLDDTYTFGVDGKMLRDVGSDFWGEGGIWPDALVGCFDATNLDNWVGAEGQDLSAWGNGAFDFTYNTSDNTLKLEGMGAYLGISKVGTEKEYNSPQADVTYKVISLVDAEVDTLVLETVLTDDTNAEFGYWKITLVSYDDAAAEPAMPVCEVAETAMVTFSMNFNNYTGSAMTPEVNGTFNNWCGNCNAMTDEDGDGVWMVTLELPIGTHEFKYAADAWADQEALTEGSACTITSNGNTNRTLVVEGNMMLPTVCWNECSNCAFDLTTADFTGKTWMLPATAGAIRVGEGIGGGNYFTNPQEWVDGKPCLFDDTFTFDATNMTVNIGAEAFTEASMTGISTDGCVAVGSLPAELAAWAGGTFGYVFTPATADTRATIEVTGKGAYIGFFKGANGKELPQPVDGSIKYEVLNYVDGPSLDVLEVAVDISADQNGAVYWTYKLVSK